MTIGIGIGIDTQIRNYILTSSGDIPANAVQYEDLQYVLYEDTNYVLYE